MSLDIDQIRLRIQFREVATGKPGRKFLVKENGVFRKIWIHHNGGHLIANNREQVDLKQVEVIA